MPNGGFVNEDELREALDNKSFKDLNNNLKKFILKINDDVEPDSVIVCEKSGGMNKSDLVLVIDGKRIGLSVKKGFSNSVHQEKVEDFINHLRSTFGDNKQVFDEIRRFIWGDGTLDGNGLKEGRLSAPQYGKSYPESVHIINNYFSDKIEYLLKRFLILGDKSKVVPDFIYYGSINDGDCISSEVAIEYLSDISNKSNGLIPIGGLTFQAWNRAIAPESVSEHKRGVVQLKWQNISRDLKSIEQRS